MNKIKLNFNHKSSKAWLTLISAILAGVGGVLSALGVNVNNDTLSTISGIAAGVISLLTATGILVAPTDKKNEGDK